MNGRGKIEGRKTNGERRWRWTKAGRAGVARGQTDVRWRHGSGLRGWFCGACVGKEKPRKASPTFWVSTLARKELISLGSSSLDHSDPKYFVLPPGPLGTPLPMAASWIPYPCKCALWNWTELGSNTTVVAQGAVTNTTHRAAWTTDIYFSLFWSLRNPRPRCQLIRLLVGLSSWLADSCLLIVRSDGHCVLSERESSALSSFLTRKLIPL